MPRVWRHLLARYFQVFFLSVFSFIALLLVSRFKELARFAALTVDWNKTFQFILALIPAVLPLAVPLSAIVASFLLMQRLDREGELTTLRSSSMGIGSIFLPICLSAALLSVLLFSLCADVVPYCRREMRTLLYRETSANPFLQMARQRFVHIPDLYLKLKVKEEGKVAHDVMAVFFNQKENKLSFATARKLHLLNEEIIADHLSLITAGHFQKQEALLIENQEKLEMAAPILQSVLKKNRPTLDASTLNLKMLQIRSQGWGKSARSARVEIIRRISLSLSVFTFTIVGFSFGVEIGRVRTRKGLFKTVSLGLVFLICYLLGRSLKEQLLLPLFLFSAPHLGLWICSFLHIRNVEKGAC